MHHFMSNKALAATFTILSFLLSGIFLVAIQTQNSTALFGRLKPSPTSSATSPSACVVYDKVENSITVSCASAHLTDVYNQLHNPTILAKEQQQSGKNNVNNGVGGASRLLPLSSVFGKIWLPIVDVSLNEPCFTIFSSDFTTSFDR